MKIWQVTAIPVCLGIWLFIAAANIDAMSLLAGDAALFDQHGITITARHAYAVASVSADALLAISAVAVFWQATRRHWVRAACAFTLWAICAAISWHSMWVWLGTNQGTNVVASTQSRDVYAVTKQQLDDAQKHYSWLTQTRTSKMGPKTVRQHRETVQAAEQRLDELRRQLAAVKIKVAANPIQNFEILGATLFLVINTICWPAIFGPRHPKVRPVTPAVTAPVPEVTQLQVTEVTAPPVTAVTPDDYVKHASSVTPAQVTAGHTPKFAGVTAVTEPVTVSESGPVTPKVTPLSIVPKSQPVTPPDDDTKPAGSQARCDNPNVGQVVVLQEGAERAVRLWRKRHTTDDAKGFIPTTDAWEHYQVHGTVDVSKDEFGRLLKAELNRDRKSKKIDGKAVWGYRGVAIVADQKRATITT